jgi:hypothetical protein
MQRDPWVFQEYVLRKNLLLHGERVMWRMNDMPEDCSRNTQDCENRDLLPVNLCSGYKSNCVVGLQLSTIGRSQRPLCLRHRSEAARLLRLWVWIPQGAWIFVCCECCVLSGRGLCDGLIVLPEKSYWLWCVVVCDLETSWMRRPWPTGGCCTKYKQKLLVDSNYLPHIGHQ